LSQSFVENFVEKPAKRPIRPTKFPMKFPTEARFRTFATSSRYARAGLDLIDRLLAAQALVEAMNVARRDAALDAYGIQRLW
jgi:predicted nucleic acid-binding protein